MPFPEQSTQVQYIAVGDLVKGGQLTGTFPYIYLVPGTITNTYLALNAVNTENLIDGSVTAQKLADINSLGIFPIVSGSQIYSGILTDAHFAAGANIATTKLAEGPLFLNNYQNQTVSGIKVFEYPRMYGNPQLWFDMTNKGFVETSIMSGSPIIQVNGTTIGQKKIVNFVNSGNLLLVGKLNSAQNRIDIIISGGAGGGGVTSGAPTDVSYLVLNNDSRLSNERAFTVDTSVFLPIDGGADSTYTLNLRQSSISGNYITANSIQQGHVLSGYVDLNTNQIISGNKIFNSIQRSGNPTLPADLTNKGYLDNNLNSGLAGLYNQNYVNLNQLNSGIAHPITVFNNGNKVLETKELNFLNYPSIFLVTTPNGSNRVDITLSGIPQSYIDNSLNSGLSGRAPITSNFITVGNDAGLPNERNLAVDTNNLTLTDGGANSNITIALRYGSISGNNIATNGISQGQVLNGYVDLVTGQIISGNKIFNDIQRSGNPTLPMDLVPKAYVDNNLNSGLAGIYGQNYVTRILELNDLNSGIAHPITVYNNSNKVLEAKELNFIPSTGIYITTIPANNGNRVDITISGSTGGGGPPTGAAGGDLTGTYPNPTIAFGVISGNKIAANSILQGHVANGYVDLVTGQTISGNKLFNDIQRSGFPTMPMDLVPKAYVDNNLNSGLAGVYNQNYCTITKETNDIVSGLGGVYNQNYVTRTLELNDINSGLAGVYNQGYVTRIQELNDINSGISHPITVFNNGNKVAEVKEVNFIPSTGVHIVTTPNNNGNRVDITFSGNTGTSTATGDSLTTSINQPNHGFNAGLLVYHDGSKYNLGDYNTSAKSEIFGIVQSVPDSNNFTMVTDGMVTFSGNFTAGEVYYLTSGGPFNWSNSAPSQVGLVSKPQLIGKTPISALFKNYRGIIINSGVSSTGSSQTPNLVDNVGFNATYSGNSALLLTLTAADGSALSSLNPARVAFRDSANTGKYNIRTITSPLTLTLASGSSLGVETGIKYRLYAGLLDVSGTPELCAWNPYNQVGKSLKRFNEKQLQTSTALATSSNTPQIIYSTTARPTVPFRYIGIAEVTNTNGAWNGTINDNYSLEAGCLKTNDIVGSVYSGNTTQITTTSVYTLGTGLRITQGLRVAAINYAAQSECNLIEVNATGFMTNGVASHLAMGVFSGSQFNSLNNMGFTVSVGGYGANISTGYRGKINQTNNITWQARAAGDSVDGGTLTLNSSTGIGQNSESWIKLQEIFA